MEAVEVNDTRKEEIKDLIENGLEITEKKQIANKLNNFFVESVEEINNSIPGSYNVLVSV